MQRDAYPPSRERLACGERREDEPCGQRQERENSAGGANLHREIVARQRSRRSSGAEVPDGCDERREQLSAQRSETVDEPGPGEKRYLKEVGGGLYADGYQHDSAHTDAIANCYG